MSIMVHRAEFGFLKKQASQQTTSATETTFKCLKNQMQKYIQVEDYLRVSTTAFRKN